MAAYAAISEAKMEILNHEFTEAQRETLDRYRCFLESLPSILDNVPVVFERRRRRGHQLAALGADSRLIEAAFHERYIRGLWLITDEIRIVADRHIESLHTFARESLELAGLTSRREPLSQVDFNVFSLSNSPRWKLFPPKNVSDLVHELNLRFGEIRRAVGELQYTLTTLYHDSFGLESAVMRVFEHRSCNCHSYPVVVEELFREARTTPSWDVRYSSRDPAFRAREYVADIDVLFSRFVSVSGYLGLFVEGLHVCVRHIQADLSQATGASTLGSMNLQLSLVVDGANRCRAMLGDLEQWLRNEKRPMFP